MACVQLSRNYHAIITHRGVVPTTHACHDRIEVLRRLLENERADRMMHGRTMTCA